MGIEPRINWIYKTSCNQISHVLYELHNSHLNPSLILLKQKSISCTFKYSNQISVISWLTNNFLIKEFSYHGTQNNNIKPTKKVEIWFNFPSRLFISFLLFLYFNFFLSPWKLSWVKWLNFYIIIFKCGGKSMKRIDKKGIFFFHSMFFSLSYFCELLIIYHYCLFFYRLPDNFLKGKLTRF